MSLFALEYDIMLRVLPHKANSMRHNLTNPTELRPMHGLIYYNINNLLLYVTDFVVS
jgi:hypothetical protein